MSSSVCRLCSAVLGCCGYSTFLKTIDCYYSVFDSPTTKRYICVFVHIVCVGIHILKTYYSGEACG